MTERDDTRQPARLPLMDRAQLGLPVEEPELIPQQITELEFPEDSPATARRWWRERIEQAIERGDLAAREVRTVTRTLGGVRMVRTYLDGALVPDSQKVERVPSSTPNNRHELKTWRVSRDAYRTWRAALENLPTPAVSFIRLWLGEAIAPAPVPQSEPAPSAPTLPQGEPDKSESGAAPAPVPQSEPASSAPTLPQSELATPKRGGAESRQSKRVDALAEAIEVALEVLTPDGRLPTPAKLFEYLRTQDKTGAVIPSDDETYFYWVTGSGKEIKATISSISQRLDRMKNGA